MVKLRLAAPLLIVFCILNTISQTVTQTKPSLILFGGKVFTGAEASGVAEAIAIVDDRIAAVGPNESVRKLAGPQTRLIDLHGRTVIPGINDAHFHFMPHPDGVQLQFATMEPSWDEVVSEVQAKAKTAPKGKWIFGSIGGKALADPRANRTTLDLVSPDNPVSLKAFYGHGMIINSSAIQHLNFSDKEVDPLGGRFEHDDSGRLNGRVWEYAQWRIERVFSDAVTDEQAIAELNGLAAEATSLGITSMQIMPTMRVERFVKLLSMADLPIRVRAMPFSLTVPSSRDLSEIDSLAGIRPGSDRVTASGIKWILDGTPNEYGAALRGPYNDRPGYSGALEFPEAEVGKMVKEALARKQQLLVHCAGDRPIELLFAAMKSQQVKDWKPLRWRIEHGDALTSDLFPQAQKLGVVVVQNPTHLSAVELMYNRYSPKTNFFNLRSIIQAGIPLALGSDGPLNPYLNIMFASVNPVRPTEAITREQAVGAYTLGSAYAEFADDEKGTLARGKKADLAVLSQDIFAVDTDKLPATTSVLTIMGGKIVHDANVLR